MASENTQSTQKDDTQSAHAKARPFIVVTGIVILVLLGWLIYRTTTVDQQLGGPSEPQRVDEGVDEEIDRAGSIWFQIDEGKPLFTPGEDITITLYADSNGYPISGYDAVVMLAEEDATLVEVTSLVPEFQIYDNVENGRVSITGVRDFNATEDFIFQNEPIATLTFAPQREGTLAFELLFEGEGETTDSNLVMTSTRDVLASTQGVTVSVTEGTLMTLTAKTQQLDDSTTATLKEVIEPDPSCADCFTEVIVTVNNGVQAQDVTFNFGGFAGQTFDSQDVFGYTLVAEDFTTSSVELRYAAQ